MGIECIQNARLEDTGFSYTISLIPILDQMCDWGEEHRRNQVSQQLL